LVTKVGRALGLEVFDSRNDLILAWENIQLGMQHRRLIEMTAAEFIEAVASPEHAVPAGSSVAALAAASSAALLVLVCVVLAGHGQLHVAATQQTARSLQQQLLEFVDEDARAYRAVLESERGSPTRREASVVAARIPVEIGRASSQIVELASALEPHVSGAIRLDLGAAKRMAGAAMESALDMGEYDLRMVADPAARQTLRDEIAQLRQSDR
jgi:formiminotetrahydrofolate cyclodeaminase